MEVKKYTEEELENLSREEFIKVVTESIQQCETLKEEAEKAKKNKSYWFDRYNEESARADKAEKSLALVTKQRDSAIKAVANLALAVSPTEPTTQE